MPNQTSDNSFIDKARRIMNYWVGHNKAHISENEQWLEKLKEAGQYEAALELERAVDSLTEANKHIELAVLRLKQGLGIDGHNRSQGQRTMELKRPGPGNNTLEGDVTCKKIGTIRTPYKDNAPYQPVDGDRGEFKLVLEPAFTGGLERLSDFKYIYVLYYMHRLVGNVSMKVLPPWTAGTEVGIFASRSPARPNRIGLSVVRVRSISDNIVYTSGLDVFDMTPLLDIKPYLKDLDAKQDANYGWVEDIDGYEHLLLHIKGIPHDY